jgi:geranylgeranylglycerol-phosphate geranylgeranyltransferase
MMIGDRNAGIVAAVFYVLGPLLSFIPFFTGLFGILYAVVIVADAIFIYCAVLVFSNPHKSEKLAKVAMFVALISFILGVAL